MITKLEMTLSMHSNIGKAQTASQTMGATINNESSTTEPRPYNTSI